MLSWKRRNEGGTLKARTRVPSTKVPADFKREMESESVAGPSDPSGPRSVWRAERPWDGGAKRRWGWGRRRHIPLKRQQSRPR
jgi:hypothetical protein